MYFSKETNLSFDRSLFLKSIGFCLAVIFLMSEYSLAQVELEEIVVTSRKREESLRDIPDSITVFDTTVIDRANITSIQNFADLTPNLTIIDQLRPGTQTMTIRGMTTIQNGELPVAFVVDGVNAPSMNFINQELIDVERIEVLRGPQGTLYGRGAVGGAINIITKEPTDEFEFVGKATYGSGNALFAGATISGPISDHLAFRLSASKRDEDGLIDNLGAGTEADPIDETTIQARLIYRPNDRLSVDWRGRMLDGEAGGIYLVRIGTEDIDDFTIPVSSNINGFDDRDIHSTSLKVDYVLSNGATFTSISAYNDTDSYFYGDGDFSDAVLFAQDWVIDVKAFNQEFRLVSDDSQDLRWILGAFYQDREDTELTNFGMEAPGFTVIPFPGGQRETRDRKSWAVFGQLDYDLSEQLSISAGVRYDEEENFSDVGQLSVKAEKTFSEVQPKISLSYDWDENVMTYATISRGFRPGGFSPTSGVLYENEISDNFEIGIKASSPDSRIQFSGALFYIDFSDQQYFYSRVTDGGVQRFIANIEDTSITGGELELSVKLAEGWDLNLGYGLTDTEIDDFDGSGDFIGNKTPQVNDHTFNISSQYTKIISNGWQFVGRVDFENRGEVNWDLSNTVTTSSKDYLNFYAGIENDSLTLFLFGKNILDEQQPTAMGTDVFGPGIHLRTPSRPESYGVGLKFRF
tara:strand:- start:5809 stop:7884 length:2076 start_codon:yes stop_codon:yes gene_type:complete